MISARFVRVRARVWVCVCANKRERERERFGVACVRARLSLYVRPFFFVRVYAIRDTREPPTFIFSLSLSSVTYLPPSHPPSHLPGENLEACSTKKIAKRSKKKNKKRERKHLLFYNSVLYFFLNKTSTM